MKLVTKKIKNALEKIKISQKKLARSINYSHGALSSIINGEEAFPIHIIEKIAPVLEVTVDEVKGWILADAHPKEILELALKHKNEVKKKKKELILTIQIDSILKQKNMSRTALSKQIKYCQSSLNKMITGKIKLSNTVIERIAPILEVSENEILSWAVADKYSIEVIELAMTNL